ncbi:MAG: nucleotidyl transferase AbiEii/AbiGii toxin family protein [Ignavibacteria bacterium]|nr:nucleotidyl transferase AbiEii/AbiGii toxin family protein [Ignavibacteria bacterium]
MESESALVKVHLEVLGSRQNIVLKQVGPILARRGCYLAGGTGLALYLGHRKSVDLDFFSPHPIGDMLRVADSLRTEGVPIVVETVGRGTLHGTIRGIRTILLEYRYSNLKAPRLIPQFGCLLASPEDIAAMKLSAVAQRGSKKDFIDLYALLEKYLSLDEMLNAYRRRYHVKDTLHVLQALTYFDEADEQRAPTMLWNVAWADVKRKLQGCVRETFHRRQRRK